MSVEYPEWLNYIKQVKKLQVKRVARFIEEKKTLITNNHNDLDFPKFTESINVIKLPINKELNSINNSMPDLKLGDTSGVDYDTIKVMDKGLYPIDKSLDLHFHNQNEAFSALYHTIAEARRLGHRMIMVITGKGSPSINQPSILRQMMPNWINSPLIRPNVLRFTYAAKQHGGTGAFYILLKRVRNKNT